MNNENTSKQLKHTTVIKYNSREAWRAVLKRSGDYRLDCSRICRLEDGAYWHYASYELDRAMAVDVLIEIDAIDFSPAGSFRAVILSR